MEYKNGYFQVINKEDGTYLKLFPAQGGGSQIEFEEVARYLTKVNVTLFEADVLRTSIAANKADELRISEAITEPITESMTIEISPERDFATARFYPPSNDGRQMEQNDIIKELESKSVTFGHDSFEIEKFLLERYYCTNYTVAKALKPKEGKDAVITYMFNTNKLAKPKENEDGSVNFHELGIIEPVEKGAVIATLEPAVFGKPGMDICGNKIQPKTIAVKSLKHGHNAHLSEDKLTMYADVSGQVSLVEDRVFVFDTYEVLADVDNSTGDIEFDGNVSVKGNVRTGFRIYATGNIVVEGIVEGANLYAEGEIVLKRGIQGMNRGELRAKGNIATKFIENSIVSADGNIITEAILHSKVSAKGAVSVGGKKGYVTGGEVRSGSLIEVKTAGSTMGTSTLLEVGLDPEVMEELKQLKIEVETLGKEKEDLLKSLVMFKKKIQTGEKLSPEKMVQLQQATKALQEIDGELQHKNFKCETIEQLLENNKSGRVRVYDSVFPGVKIEISNVSTVIRAKTQYSMFIRDGADIRVTAL